MNDIEGTIKLNYINDEFMEYLFPKYPRWEKRCIKRKYGKHPAIYLDVWVPFEQRMYDLIPRVSNLGLTARWRVQSDEVT